RRFSSSGRSVISSMLLKPTMRVPFTCSAPKRLEVSTIGSPSVFHTAPPQPMSNARMTCSPVFVGGALASQNGFGLLIPAKEMERSAMGDPLLARALGPPGRGSRARGGAEARSIAARARGRHAPKARDVVCDAARLTRRSGAATDRSQFRALAVVRRAPAVLDRSDHDEEPIRSV